MVKETASRCTRNTKTHTDRNLRMPSSGKDSSSKNDKGILKLFGVEILIESERDSDEAMKKTFDTANLDNDNHGGFAHHCPPDGYLSVSDARKKAKPWTKEEHQLFLVGLEKLGKGEWKAIAESYVRTRTSTQVASHAQKYFLRLAAPDEKKKRRCSIFDTPLQQPAMDVRENRHERHIMASCNSVLLHSSSSGSVTENFPRPGILRVAQAQWLTPSIKLSLGSAQLQQRAPSPAAFDNLELRLWHTNDSNPIYLNQVPGPSKLSDVRSKHIAFLYTPTNQRM